MKFTLLLAIFLLCAQFFSSCQKNAPGNRESDGNGDLDTPPVDTVTALPDTFQKTYGGVDDEYAGTVLPTNDSGYILAASTMSYASVGDEDIYLVKVDQRGNTQWTKTYGTPWLPEEGFGIKQTTDGGYIIGGFGYACDGAENFILVKTDASGDIQWNRAYGDFHSEGYYDFLQANDGGYIVVGPARSKGIFCIKVNENGEVAWHKEYSLYTRSKGALIVNTNDGGYAIVGSSKASTYGSETNYILLIKTDINGNVLWSKTYDEGYRTLQPGSLKQTIDGGFIIAGTGALVIRTDASGNLTWSRAYAGTDWESDIEQTTDGGYVFSCVTGNYAGLIKTDINGEVIWSKKYGGGQEIAGSVHQVKDGGYVIGGQTSAFGAGAIDLYLIKTDSSGSSGCNENAFTVTVATPALQVKTATVTVLDGSIDCICSPRFLIGTRGTETTLCSK